MREDNLMSPVSMTRAGRFPRTLRYAAGAAVLGALLGLAPVGFGHASGAETTQLRINAQSFGTTRQISLDVNKSMLVDLPVDVQEVIVSQPGVANAILRNKRRAIIQATGAGNTNIFFMDASGRTIVVLDVSNKGVNNEAASVATVLRETFAKVIPNADIEVEAVAMTNAKGDLINRIVLSGSTSSVAEADKALSIASQFAGSPENVTSVLNVSGSQQVMLKVTVAEVKRDISKQLGINLTSTFSIGGISGSFTNTPEADLTTNGVKATLPVNMPFGSASVDMAVRALEEHGAIRLLAEPVLTATSGQQADFLAGGEIRYQTGTDDNGVPVYDYKEYGVKLSFTPTIKAGGQIGLVVNTSVSEPQADASLNKREVKTNVELGVGQTLSIAGLLDERTRQQINRLPGLGDIPILGALFRSREYISNKTELVFLVTPYLARPSNEAPVLPTEASANANDAEAIFLGRLETVYGVGPAGTRGSYDGQVGFLLD